MKPRDLVIARSGGQCEAMVLVGRVWTRCWYSPVEVHHVLTRARGGVILDKAGETYHLLALCPEHHHMADGSEAYASGLLIDGYVTTGIEGEPVYVGTDDYLSGKYPNAERVG